MSTRAIIVAAGRGRRLGPETAEIPKCMVKVGVPGRPARPILHRAADALAAAGARELVIVRGYLGDRIAAPTNALLTVRFVENPKWAENNILASLLYAERDFAGGFLFSYSDIVFARAHARAVTDAKIDEVGGVALLIDRRWRDAYVGRQMHPVSEAELARVEETPRGPRVTRVGKTLVAADDAAGEFSGLARFSARAAEALVDVWREALARGLETPFGAAATLRNAYLSDALNALAARGVPLVPVFADGGWREIDTEEDLSRAHAVVDTWD